MLETAAAPHVNASVQKQITGLTTDQVRERVARGQVNVAPTISSRSVSSIIWRNLLTRFNILLGMLLVAILVIGPLQDALFGLALLVNTPIGVVQELRAKRALDRLTVLSTPNARVIRAGRDQQIIVSELVVDDMIELRPGDQMPVDGDVIRSSGLEVDESLLTGESAPVEKGEGDETLSGSFVVAGSGLVRATRVGPAAYGNVLAADARRFKPVRSELRRGIDRFLLIIAIVIGPAGTALVLSQLAANNTPVEAVRASVAGLVTMVPEGLVLLTSVVFAVAAVRFGQRGIVAQELASVEMLARADVVCLDKTGTLTDGKMKVERVIPLSDIDVAQAMGALAAADPHPNSTLAAVAAAFPPAGGWALIAAVPFSSSRRWSGAAFVEHGSWVIGAPEAVLGASNTGAVHDVAAHYAATGARVVVVGQVAEPLRADAPLPEVQPVALVLIRENLRPDAAEVVAYYLEQGVAIKVISGDGAQTVAALAAAVHVPGAATPVNGRELPDDDAALADVAEANSVFGRVNPQQKRAIVRALQSRGHVVAMTGDGVNDVLALKEADIGIAMGSGTAATRAVAQLTLLHDSFASVPFAIREGRRVIANLERVAAFFLTKTVYAMVLVLAVALRTTPFPLLPRQLSLYGLLAIGVPAFALSFAPSAERARSGFVRRTLRFAIPAGLIAGAASYAAFEVALNSGMGIGISRTIATTVLLGIGLWVVGRVARPLNIWKVGLIVAMVGGVALGFAVPFGRVLYGLDLLDARAWLECLAVTSVAIATLEGALRLGERVSEAVSRHSTRRVTTSQS
jgi:magnesium-transporting ATPase (P-type)